MTKKMTPKLHGSCPEGWREDWRGGWLEAARHVPSPNFNARPAHVSVDLLVVHNISLPPGEFGGQGIEQLFTNTLNSAEHPYYATIASLEVSAHFLIRRDGEIVQFVSVDNRAWHAGQSLWCDRDNCNDFSVGIELEGTDDLPYEEIQYTQLQRLVDALRRYFPRLDADAVVGHSDIAPGRKTDPGPAFDWSRLR
jgi:AmpD protein